MGPIAFGAVAEGAGMTHLDAVELQESLELRDALGVRGHHIDPADFHHGEVREVRRGPEESTSEVISNIILGDCCKTQQTFKQKTSKLWV